MSGGTTVGKGTPIEPASDMIADYTFVPGGYFADFMEESFPLDDPTFSVLDFFLPRGCSDTWIFHLRVGTTEKVDLHRAAYLADLAGHHSISTTHLPVVPATKKGALLMAKDVFDTLYPGCLFEDDIFEAQLAMIRLESPDYSNAVARKTAKSRAESFMEHVLDTTGARIITCDELAERAEQLMSDAAPIWEESKRRRAVRKAEHQAKRAAR